MEERADYVNRKGGIAWMIFIGLNFLLTILGSLVTWNVLEKQMLKLESIEEAVKFADQSTSIADWLMNGVDANGSGQVDPYEDECGLSQIESYGLLAGSITLQQGPLAS